MIYYPVPLHKQKAFSEFAVDDKEYPITDMLCESVISLPIHTEMDEEQLEFITSTVKAFFN